MKKTSKNECFGIILFLDCFLNNLWLIIGSGHREVIFDKLFVCLFISTFLHFSETNFALAKNFFFLVIFFWTLWLFIFHLHIYCCIIHCHLLITFVIFLAVSLWLLSKTFCETNNQLQMNMVKVLHKLSVILIFPSCANAKKNWLINSYFHQLKILQHWHLAFFLLHFISVAST